MKIMSIEQEKEIEEMQNYVLGCLKNHLKVKKVKMNKFREIYFETDSGSVLYFGKLRMKINPENYNNFFETGQFPMEYR